MVGGPWSRSECEKQSKSVCASLYHSRAAIDISFLCSSLFFQLLYVFYVFSVVFFVVVENCDTSCLCCE